jgi:type IV secretory pathway VirB10-like protein
MDLSGGTVGGRDGANGIESHVDNHYLQLGMAAVLSAAFGIGPRVAAGSQQGFAPSLPQEFANQAATSFNQAGQKIIERELLRAPTLTQEAGTPVTIQLSESVSFQQPPKRSAR